MDTDVQIDDLLQQYSSIPVCDTAQTEDSVEINRSINFHHFFSLQIDSHGSQANVKSTKAIYAELFGLSKKVIDCALKADMQHELANLFKSFIYDAQNKYRLETTSFADVENPTITKHKGRPPKRLKSSVETNTSFKGKQPLKDSTKVNIADNNNIDDTSSTRGRKCGKCKQYSHYAKTCQSAI